ncbi:SPOR domain-containing protein [Desulfomicrobium baculatum]|uniref:Sporulation domain protein n=1 Tax=Desulfomicrobium baculatum (strain DSM 4028 / VKM B-1378 / X) TaxID=525897 RepID=C7LUG6_DESBD|nr:SPOR domain-containing protein [Desulfomicrobium baculatum]ACU89701.1 Sporulation domain protein [Desulfomicrobium baculatum DSM 4028]
MITRKSSTTKKKDKNKLSFQLGLSGFLSLAVLVVIGMAWSFILGIIVGRGYQPEKMAMEMAQKVLPEDFPLLTEKNEEVLKGEELEFFDKLKQGPTSVAPAPAPQAKAPTPPPVKPETAAAPKPQQSAIDAALQSAAVAAGQSPTPAAKVAKEEVFVFNYQVAALASMEQAQTFLKKLDPSKFKTSVVTATHEGKTWYRVYVHHQGTVDSALALKEQLKGSGIGGMLLRSRTPL